MTVDLSGKRFFHGSYDDLPVGTLLSPRGDDYEASWGHTDFFDVLERRRPEGMRAHRDAVFMVSEVDDVELAGGAIDFCFELEPIGAVTRHDINWSSEISSLVSESVGMDDPRVIEAADNYWAGVPHYNESVWEYLVGEARVIRCEPYETFDVEDSFVP